MQRLLGGIPILGFLGTNRIPPGRFSERPSLLHRNSLLILHTKGMIPSTSRKMVRAPQRIFDAFLDAPRSPSRSPLGPLSTIFAVRRRVSRLSDGGLGLDFALVPAKHVFDVLRSSKTRQCNDESHNCVASPGPGKFTKHACAPGSRAVANGGACEGEKRIVGSEREGNANIHLHSEKRHRDQREDRMGVWDATRRRKLGAEE